jgi:hypothetical protein
MLAERKDIKRKKREIQKTWLWRKRRGEDVFRSTDAWLCAE